MPLPHSLPKRLSHNSTISLYTALSSSTSCSISLLLFPIAIFCNSFSFFPSFSFTLFDAISHYTFLYLCNTIPLLLPFLFSNQFVFVACSLSLSLSLSLTLALTVYLPSRPLSLSLYFLLSTCLLLFSSLYFSLTYISPSLYLFYLTCYLSLYSSFFSVSLHSLSLSLLLSPSLSLTLSPTYISPSMSLL